MTLCIVHSGSKVLLGLKKRGFGQGKWNGFGGKVIDGEKVEEAAKRELFEESGLKVSSMEKLGVLDFSWQGKEEKLVVHIFKASDIAGKAKETDEMKPQWFTIKDIPYQSMWADDQYWLPLFLENKKFEGSFIFDNNDNIISFQLS